MTEDYGSERIVSTNTKVRQVCALRDSDLTPWQIGFRETLIRQTASGTNVGTLTDKQLEVLDSIWKRHFA